MKKVLSLFALTCMTLSISLTSCKKDEDEALPAPAVENFMPTTGIQGTNVIITGTNFSTTPAKNEVKFNGTKAVVSAATKTQLTVVVPANATTGKISVKANGSTVVTTNDFVVPGTPQITSVEPATAAVGAEVTINGTNFGALVADNIVKFNGVTANIYTASATKLVVSVPANATTGKITVTTSGLTATSANDFIVIQQPTITAFAPLAAARGANVVVTGTNFSATPANNSVRINGVLSTVTAATTTQVTITVPATATTGKITVRVNGLTGESADPFTVQLAPVITAFNPASGAAGQQVRIDGLNFDPVTNRVYFDGIESPHTLSVGDRIVASVPAGTTTGKIRVTNIGGSGESEQEFLVTNTFDIVAAPGGPTRTNCRVAFVIDGKGYTGASGQVGLHDNYKGFWEYDPSENVWTQKAEFGGVARNGSTGFAIGFKGYVVTGHAAGPIKDCWEYNSTNNTWTKKNDFTGEARSGAAAFTIGTKGYIGMGFSMANSLYDLWEYDNITDQWTRKKDLPAIATPKEYGTSFAIGTKGYVGGGGQTANAGLDFWEYDPATDDWTPKKDMPDKTAKGSFVIGANAYVSIFTGGSGKLWHYSVAQDTWTEKLNGHAIGLYTEGFAVGNFGYMRLSSGGQAAFRYTP